MPRRPMPSHARLEQAPRPSSQLIGKPRDAKRENSFYDGGVSARRSLTQELQADRKR